MKKVVVIGGGVVGLSTAYALIRAGIEVTLLEASASVGKGCSYANGGQLSYHYISPLANSDVPFKALGWMAMGSRSPLRFVPKLDWAQWRWLFRFLLACRGSVNAQNTKQLFALALKSREELGCWQAEAQLDKFSWRNSGKLVLYREPAALKRAGQHLLDPAQRVLSRDACIDLDASLIHLADMACGGLFTPGDDVADCHAFCLAILKQLQASPGFTLRENARVERFVVHEQQAVAVRVAQEEIPCDEVVIANGLASVELAQQLGLRLPIYPLKGYSLTQSISQDQLAPTVSVTDLENKVVYARLGNSLRAAAMVDIVGPDSEIDARRISHLRRLTGEAFPGLEGEQQIWAGLRPATPDGMPIIGRRQHKNVWFNVGHGALGFTLAAGCARILSDSIVKGQESLECMPFNVR